MSHEKKARICLPDDDNPVAEDQDCYATGWGHVQENGFPSDILQEVKVKRVSLARCNSILSYEGTKDETMTYAGYESGGRDACQNDSGGSMVCRVKGNFFKHFKENYFCTCYQISSQLLKKCLIKSGANNCSVSKMFEKIANLKIWGKFWCFFFFVATCVYYWNFSWPKTTNFFAIKSLSFVTLESSGG